MAHVIYCDPKQDLEVRKLFRSISPKHSKKKVSAREFNQKIYPKFNSFLKRKQKKKMEALAKKEVQIQKTMKQVDYSKKWKKGVHCANQKPFLKRNEENVKQMHTRLQKNAKLKQKLEDDTASSFSFHPNIHGKSKQIGSRSVKDWYGWDKDRHKRRLERLRKRDEFIMSKCVGRFRSPQRRKQKNKSVHLSQRYGTGNWEAF